MLQRLTNVKQRSFLFNTKVGKSITTRSRLVPRYNGALGRLSPTLRNHFLRRCCRRRAPLPDSPERTHFWSRATVAFRSNTTLH